MHQISTLLKEVQYSWSSSCFFLSFPLSLSISLTPLKLYLCFEHWKLESQHLPRKSLPMIYKIQLHYSLFTIKWYDIPQRNIVWIWQVMLLLIWWKRNWNNFQHLLQCFACSNLVFYYVLVDRLGSLFNGLPTFMGYLMPKPSLKKNISYNI